MTALSKADRAGLRKDHRLMHRSNLDNEVIPDLLDTCDELERDYADAKQMCLDVTKQRNDMLRDLRNAEAERDLLVAERDHCTKNHVPQLSAISGALLDAGCRVGDVDTFAPAIRLLAARVEMLRNAADLGLHWIPAEHAGNRQIVKDALNATDDEVRAWQQARK